MRGLVRLLFMFGPMLLRMFQRYQRNNQRNRGYDQRNRDPRYDDRSRNRGYDRGNQPSRDPYYREEEQRRQEVRRRPVVAPPVPTAPKKSEEQINFELKEKDFMLDPELLEDYEKEGRSTQDFDIAPEEASAEQVLEMKSNNEDIVDLDLEKNPANQPEELEIEDKEKLEIDLKNIFFDGDKES